MLALCARGECFLSWRLFQQCANIAPSVKSALTRKDNDHRALDAALVACFLFYAALAIVWIATKAAHRRGLLDRPLRLVGLGKFARRPTDEATEAEPVKKTRLKSLDTFRG